MAQVEVSGTPLEQVKLSIAKPKVELVPAIVKEVMSLALLSDPNNMGEEPETALNFSTSVPFITTVKSQIKLFASNPKPF